MERVSIFSMMARSKNVNRISITSTKNLKLLLFLRNRYPKPPSLLSALALVSCLLPLPFSLLFSSWPSSLKLVELPLQPQVPVPPLHSRPIIPTGDLAIWGKKMSWVLCWTSRLRNRGNMEGNTEGNSQRDENDKLILHINHFFLYFFSAILMISSPVKMPSSWVNMITVFNIILPIL